MENKEDYSGYNYMLNKTPIEIKSFNIARKELKEEIEFNKTSFKGLMLSNYQANQKESYRTEPLYFGMDGSSVIGDKEEASYKIKEDPLCLYSSEEYKSNIYQSLTREKLREAVDYVFKHNQYNSTTL